MIMRSRARDVPMSRGSRWVPPVPGSTPSVTSGRPIRPESFAADLRAYAEALAQGPARAVSLIKRSVVEGVEMPLTAGLALERELQNRLFITEDAKEGLAAFVEKRKPSFKGR